MKLVENREFGYSFDPEEQDLEVYIHNPNPNVVVAAHAYVYFDKAEASALYEFLKEQYGD